MYPFLYKYCKFTKDNYDLKNFQNDFLYFNSPTGYNDPYEGVIATSVVDLVEAFFVAHIAKSCSVDEAIAFAEKFFSLPRALEAIETVQDIQSVRKRLFDVMYEAVQHVETNFAVLVSIQLFRDDTYLALFPQISNASLTIEEYEAVVRDAISRMEDLFEFEKPKLIALLTENYAEKYRIVNSLREKTIVIVPIYLVDAINNTPFKRASYEETLINCNDVALEMFEVIRQLPGKLFKTTCLSENPKSILMWSHYASQHTGFCIEYDFNQATGTGFPLDRLAKVTYSDEMPMLDLRSMIQMVCKRIDQEYIKDPAITQLIGETCIEAILTKNSAWKYEAEWRIVLDNFSNVQIVKIPFATKIILGMNIDEKNKEELLRIAHEKEPPIPVYQAFLRPDKYEIGYYPLD